MWQDPRAERRVAEPLIFNKSISAAYGSSFLKVLQVMHSFIKFSKSEIRYQNDVSIQINDYFYTNFSLWTKFLFLDRTNNTGLALNNICEV